MQPIFFMPGDTLNHTINKTLARLHHTRGLQLHWNLTFSQTLTPPTHVDSNLLDLPIISPNLDLIANCTVEKDTYGRDHFSTAITLQYAILPPPPPPFTHNTYTLPNLLSSEIEYTKVTFNPLKTNTSDDFKKFPEKNMPSFSSTPRSPTWLPSIPTSF